MLELREIAERVVNNSLIGRAGLLALFAFVLALAVLPGRALALKPIIVAPEEERIEITPLGEFYDGRGDSLQVMASLASPPIRLLAEGHQASKLTSEQRRRITAWIDMNCPLTDTYGQLQQAKR